MEANELGLLPEEVAYLAENDGARCRSCGHLNALHNEHCCPFCMVTDCPCEWGRLPCTLTREDAVPVDVGPGKPAPDGLYYCSEHGVWHREEP